MVEFDTISLQISTFNFQPFTEISLFIDTFTYPLLAIFLLYLIFVKKDMKKSITIGITYLFLILIIPVLKLTLSEVRPCSAPWKIECPSDYALPSGHAAAMAVPAIAYLTAPSFPLVLLLYILVSLSRVYLGIHVFKDILAGTVISISVFLFVKKMFLPNIEHYFSRLRGFAIDEKEKSDTEKSISARNELARQITHLLFGILLIGGMALLWSLTHSWHYISIFIMWICILFFLFVIHLRTGGFRTPFDGFFDYMGKRDEFPGEGLLWYMLGVALAISFLPRFLYIISAIYILAVGDSISTVFAYKRRYRYSLFKGRNWMSYIAFVASTLPITFFVGVKAIPLIIICAITESLDLKVNDNFLIPLVCTAYFLLI
ncbi:MAG: phosphatase PAP2 family protein [Candidatus Micrarchaeia archaeon]